MTASLEVLRVAGLELALRPSVAHRLQHRAGSTFIYLSLLDDEIELRFERFLARNAKATYLEPTDAALALSGDSHLRVMRGACCSFPLYRRDTTTGAHVATQLPITEGPLSAGGLVAALASAASQGSFEPNALIRTPLSGWNRLRRGAETSHSSGVWRDEPIAHNHNRDRGTRPDKGILRQAVPQLLPAAVVGRRGKVAYDGVWMRAYAKNADHICSTIERAADILEHIGISPAWVIRRARALASWEPLPTGEVLAAYALATWLAAWEIDQISALGR